MEAIAELIAAIISVMTQAVLGLFEVVFGLLGMVVEFTILALTQGVSAASKRMQLRKQQRAERQSRLKLATDGAASHGAISPNRQLSAIVTAAVMIAVLVTAGTWWILERVKVQRIAQTRSQVKLIAENTVAQIKDAAAKEPEPGKLSELDAWQQPIELFVDKALLGSLVVVRSSGPDRLSGSIDDILSIRVVQAPVKEIGGALAKLGIEALRKRAAAILRGKVDKLPKDIDVGEQ